uniref:Sodium/calcium exchanger membrane region n=1 Tax=Rhodopseudomonas palustris (strain BisA53) TaxID=316055 RepID=Q07J63_RHOP5
MLALALVGASAGLGLEFTLTPLGLAADAVLLVVLFGTVFAAVYHAEMLAHRLGEPYGTLLLTLAVTMIEVSLIATMMLGGKTVPTLARDTVFAVVMIVLNGLVGYCVLAGGLRFREQEFHLSGASLYLSVTIVLATITLILPNYTFTDPGPIYTAAQLAFVSLSTVVLYVVFLYAQTSRHRDYFVGDAGQPQAHVRTSTRMLWASAALLLTSLLAVVLLAETFSHVVEAATAWIGAPAAFAGLVVAVLILLPESIAAIGAARRNDLQKSINLALGSSLATIGLTIPSVAVVSLVLEKPLTLGLDPQEMVLLVLTFVISMLTFGTGRTNIVFGMVHLVVFALFVFLVFVP